MTRNFQLLSYLRNSLWFFFLSLLQSNCSRRSGSCVLRPFFGSSRGKVTVSTSVVVLFSVRPWWSGSGGTPGAGGGRGQPPIVSPITPPSQAARTPGVRRSPRLPLAGSGGQLSDKTSVPMPRAQTGGSFGICARKRSKQFS